MGSLVVIKLNITAQSVPCLSWVRVVVQIYLLIFDGAPQAFGKDVVQRAPFAIHADLNARRLEPFQIHVAREMTVLVAVADLWLGLA